MQLKQPEMKGINPVDRVAPVVSVVKMASTQQDLNFRVNQLVKGQDYYAHVLSKLDQKTFQVEVGGAIVQMEMNPSLNVGQTILMKYVQDSPHPTFLMSSSQQLGEETVALKYGLPISEPLSIPIETKAELSQAANIIEQYLSEAKNQGVGSEYEASRVITNTPGLPAVVANDLKQALSKTGLFYESHLVDSIEGNRSLSEIRQEPQNQSEKTIPSIVSQQLNIIETQSLSWHGEVWPGQMMQWGIHVVDDDKSNHGKSGSGSRDDNSFVSSEFTLHLPNLGKVSAKIILMNGRMKINILADEHQTIQTLKNKSPVLFKAITQNGQNVDSLSVEES